MIFQWSSLNLGAWERSTSVKCPLGFRKCASPRFPSLSQHFRHLKLFPDHLFLNTFTVQLPQGHVIGHCHPVSDPSCPTMLSMCPTPLIPRQSRLVLFKRTAPNELPSTIHSRFLSLTRIEHPAELKSPIVNRSPSRKHDLLMRRTLRKASIPSLLRASRCSGSTRRSPSLCLPAQQLILMNLRTACLHPTSDGQKTVLNCRATRGVCPFVRSRLPGWCSVER